MKAKVKAPKWSFQIRKELYKKPSEKNRALQNANNKTTKKKSSDQRRPS